MNLLVLSSMHVEFRVEVRTPPSARALEHANEEHGHADLAERITPLKGAEFKSRRAGHSQPFEVRRRQITSEHGSGGTLVAERIARESYNEIIRHLGHDDPNTHIAMKQILPKEEEHADDMKNLLETLSQGRAVY